MQAAEQKMGGRPWSAWWVVAPVVCVLVLSGHNGQITAQDVPGDSAAARLYRRACGHVARGHLDLAYEQLAEAFGYGLKSPMQVISDTCFAPLLEDSLWRKRVHDLMRRHAWDQEAVMASRTTKGERVTLVIRILVQDEPVRGAVVDFSLDDGASDGAANPRWFACLRSGDSGWVSLETEQPRQNQRGDPPFTHFHVAVQRDGLEAVQGTVELKEASQAADSAHSEPTDGSLLIWPASEGTSQGRLRTFFAEIQLRRLP